MIKFRDRLNLEMKFFGRSRLEKELRNKKARILKRERPELFCSEEKALEIKIRRREEEAKAIERDKNFYLQHAEELNYYLKKKKKYKYRKPEKTAFIEECKMRSGGVCTPAEKEMLAYIEANYDDFYERAEIMKHDTGEVLEDDGSWVCLPMYKYFPLYMSVQDMIEGRVSWNFGKR